MEHYKVYITVSPEGYVLSIGNTEGDEKTVIDEGIGDKYHHAESQYLDLRVKNHNGTHNYRYEGGQVRKATAAELAAELAEIQAAQPPREPTFEELQTEFNVDMDYRLSLVELGLA